jgi:hypothetical protein
MPYETRAMTWVTDANVSLRGKRKHGDTDIRYKKIVFASQTNIENHVIRSPQNLYILLRK